jgi:hypothetical protein
MSPISFNKSTSTTSLSSITSDKRLYTFEEAIKFEKPNSNTNSQSELSLDQSNNRMVSLVRHQHPVWNNWNAVWKQEPFEFNLELIPSPDAELDFPEASYRLYPDFPYAIYGAPIIYQGATVVFTGFESSEVRHVVEWCEYKDNRYAYLRLVGTTSKGKTFPYDHDDYPTLILAVPSNISTVPFYPHSPPSSIESLDAEEEPEVKIVMPFKKAKKYLANIANGLKKRAVKFFTI